MSIPAEVKFIEEDGVTKEPYELVIMDLQISGCCERKINLRRGSMVDMTTLESGRLRVSYCIPARGLIFRGEYLNDTGGQGLLNTLFDGWDEYAGHITESMVLWWPIEKARPQLTPHLAFSRGASSLSKKALKTGYDHWGNVLAK